MSDPGRGVNVTSGIARNVTRQPCAAPGCARTVVLDDRDRRYWAEKNQPSPTRCRPCRDARFPVAEIPPRARGERRQDVTFVCVDCHASTLFSARDQIVFEQKFGEGNVKVPKRCGPCRQRVREQPGVACSPEDARWWAAEFRKMRGLVLRPNGDTHVREETDE